MPFDQLDAATEVGAAPAAGGALAGGAPPSLPGRTSPYDTLFSSAEQKYGLPTGFLKSLAHQESSFNPRARSPAGAVGLMQFMPDTAKRFGIDPSDPVQAVDGAARYVLDLGRRFGGDLSKVAAAYNAGEGAVEKYGGIPPYKETQNYVAKVKGYFAQYGGPGAAPAAASTPRGAPAVGYNNQTGQMYVNGQTFDADNGAGWLESTKHVGKAGGALPAGFLPVAKDQYAQMVNTASTPNATLGGMLKSFASSILSSAGAGAKMGADVVLAPYNLNNPDPIDTANPGTALAGVLGLDKQGMGDQAAVRSTQALQNGDITKLDDIKKGFADAAIGGLFHLAASGLGSTIPGLAAGALNPYAGAAVFAASAGGSNGEQVKQQLLAKPEAEWQTVPEYQELVSRGTSPQGAKNILAHRAMMVVEGLTAPVGAIDALLPEAGKVASKAVSSKVLASMLKGGLKTSAFEAGQEVAEGVTQQAASNLGSGFHDDLLQGSLGNAVGGALAGHPIGAAQGGVQALNAREEQARATRTKDYLAGQPQDVLQPGAAPTASPPPGAAPTAPIPTFQQGQLPGVDPRAVPPMATQPPGVDELMDHLQADPKMLAFENAHKVAQVRYQQAQAANDPQAAQVALQQMQVAIEGATEHAKGLAQTATPQGDLFPDAPVPQAGVAPAAPPAAAQVPVPARAGAAPPAVSTPAARPVGAPVVGPGSRAARIAGAPAEWGLTSPTPTDVINPQQALSGIADGITDGLYRALFEALQSGNDTVHGVKDPALAKAKIPFDAGLITSPEDLRSFFNAGGKPGTWLRAQQMKRETATAAIPTTDSEVKRIIRAMNDTATFPEDHIESVPEPLRDEVTRRLVEHEGGGAEAALSSEQETRKRASGGKVTLSPDDVALFAKAVRNNGAVLRGPLKGLHKLIQRWDKTLNAITSANSKGKIGEHVGNRLALGSILHGEMKAFASELGTKNMDAIVAHIKAADEKSDLGGAQKSPNVRFAIAWNQYKGNRLKSESIGADEIRGSKAQEEVYADAETSRLEEIISRKADEAKNGATRAGKPIRGFMQKRADEAASRGPLRNQYLADNPVPSSNYFRIVGLLDHLLMHSPNAATRVMGRMLHGFFERTKPDFEIVVAGKNAPGAHGTFNPSTGKLVIRPSGRNERVILHELIHAATASYIFKNVGKQDPHVARLEATLADLMEHTHDSDALEQFALKNKLSEKDQKYLMNAVRNTTGAYAKATTPKARAAAIAEFVSYGLTEPDFQEFMKSIKLSETPEKFALASQKNSREPGETGLTVWSRFVEAMSQLVLGRSWGDVKETMMSRFLSDSAQLLKAANESAVAQRAADNITLESSNPDERPGNPAFNANRAKRRAGVEAARAAKMTKEAEAATSSRERTEQKRLEQADRESLFEGSAPGRSTPLGWLDNAYKLLFKAARVDTLTKGAWGLLAKGNQLTADTVPVYRAFLHQVVSGYGLSNAYLSAQHTLKMGQVHEVQAANNFFEAFNSLPEDQQLVVTDALLNPEHEDALRPNLAKEQAVALVKIKQILADTIKAGVEAGTIPKEYGERDAATLLKNVYMADILKDPSKTGLKRSTGIMGLKLSDAGKVSQVPSANVGDSPSNRYHEITEYKSSGIAEKHFIPVEDTTTFANMQAEGKDVEMTDGDHVWNELPNKAKGGKSLFHRDFTSEEMKQAGMVSDPRYLLHVTMHHLMQDIMHAEMFNFIDDFGRVDGAGDGPEVMSFGSEGDAKAHTAEHKLRPQNWVQVPETKNAAGQRKFGALSGKWVPQSVWNDIDAQVNNKPLFPGFDKWLNRWKLMKTAYSPVTHFNNIASNFALAFYRDIPAGNILRAFQIYRDTASKDPAKRAAAEKYIQEFDSSGANIGSHGANEIRRGQMLKIVSQLADKMEAEPMEKDSPAAMVKLLEMWEHAVASEMGKKASNGAGWIGNAVGTAARFSREKYEMEDNIFRLASYMTHIQNGMSIPEAGRTASSDFVDYHITAPLINKLRGSVLPFIAWPYRMIPAMIKIAVEKPWKFATMATALYGLNALGYAVAPGDEDDERKYLPEYQKGRLGGVLPVPKLIRLPWNNTFIDMSNAFPLGDILAMDNTGIFGMPWLRSFTPSGPLIMLAEALFGYDAFKGQVIRKETNSAAENMGAVAKHLAQESLPNIPIPGTTQFDSLLDVMNQKHGITGAPMNSTLKVLSLIGPKIAQQDLKEEKAIQGAMISKLYREYTAEMRGVARAEMRKGTPDHDAINERVQALNERWLKKLKEIREP